MEWVDGHLDLAYLAVRGRDLRQPSDGETGCVSLPDLREGGVRVALATIFTEPGANASDPCGYPSSDDLDAAEAAGRRQLDVYQELAASGDVSIVRAARDLEAQHDDGLRIVLLMEGADPIRSAESAEEWFNAGVRAVGLTWGLGTRYAGGNANHGPLSDSGIELVGEMDRLGIIHDASHLCDAALDGMFEHAQGSIVATHSNCRTLLNENQRHLGGDQIAEIGRRGGIIGLNLYRGFLNRDRDKVSIGDCVRHIEHVCAIIGDRVHVGLGSDMDGGFEPDELPDDLNHPRKLVNLANALRSAGWPDNEVAGFCHGNWSRFLRAALPPE